MKQTTIRGIYYRAMEKICFSPGIHLPRKALELLLQFRNTKTRFAVRLIYVLCLEFVMFNGVPTNGDRVILLQSDGEFYHVVNSSLNRHSLINVTLKFLEARRPAKSGQAGVDPFALKY